MDLFTLGSLELSPSLFVIVTSCPPHTKCFRTGNCPVFYTWPSVFFFYWTNIIYEGDNLYFWSDGLKSKRRSEIFWDIMKFSQQHCTRRTKIEIQIKTNLQKLILQLACSGYKTDGLSGRYFNLKTIETYLFIFFQRNTNRFLPNSAVIMCVMCLHKCLIACSKQIEQWKPVCLTFSVENYPKYCFKNNDKLKTKMIFVCAIK